MKLPNEIVDAAIHYTNNFIKQYKRETYLSNDKVVERAKNFYDNEKNIIWINSSNEVKDKLKNIDKPWVYHYSLHLNWVTFFTTYWGFIHNQITTEDFILKYGYTEDKLLEVLDVFQKNMNLEDILNHVDGIIEDGENIYLIKADLDFIKTKLERWKI